MSNIRQIFEPINGQPQQPDKPASIQHPDCVRYTVGLYVVDAIGGEPTLEEIEALLFPRTVRVAAIEAERDGALLAGVSWDGKAWHLDQVFQAQVSGLVVAFEAGILPGNATVPIRTRANTVEQLDYTQLKQLAGAVLVRVQQIWAASWAAKDALE